MSVDIRCVSRFSSLSRVFVFSCTYSRFSYRTCPWTSSLLVLPILSRPCLKYWLATSARTEYWCRLLCTRGVIIVYYYYYVSTVFHIRRPLVRPYWYSIGLLSPIIPVYVTYLFAVWDFRSSSRWFRENQYANLFTWILIIRSVK